LDACQLSVPRASLLPASKNLHTSGNGSAAISSSAGKIGTPFLCRGRRKGLPNGLAA
jgi:hypothetical protein